MTEEATMVMYALLAISFIAGLLIGMGVTKRPEHRDNEARKRGP